ncbi:MAG: glycosyltransferase family 4 protein [Chloroflexota bacterium]
MKVLLVSPRLPQGHPLYGGDNAYTDTILQNPPPGVEYHHYEDLIGAGSIRKIAFWYSLGPRLKNLCILPPDLWAEYLHSEFVPDIVHIVGFSAAVDFQPGIRVPVILEAPSGSVSDLIVKLGWSEKRTRFAHRIKRQYLKLANAHDSNLNNDNAYKVIVQSEHSRYLHEKYGYGDPEKLVVLRPAVPEPQAPIQVHPRETITMAFVGGDFERKNGPLVVEAFRIVHARYPNTRLILIGRSKNDQIIQCEGIEHHLSLSRMAIYQQIYPQADILLFPTQAEGGFGVVIYEAMRFGLAVISVEAWAIPEIVVNDETGLLIPHPPSLDTLVDAIIDIVKNPEKLLNMRNQALQRALSKYALSERQRQLGSIYSAALNAGNKR